MGCEVKWAPRPRPLLPRTSVSTAHKIAIDFEPGIYIYKYICVPPKPDEYSLASQIVAVTYVLN